MYRLLGLVRRDLKVDLGRNTRTFDQLVEVWGSEKIHEKRRYYLKLWESEYNYQRPHQGLGNPTPMQL